MISTLDDTIIPTEILRDLTAVEKEAFNASFLDFFGCFEQGKASPQRGGLTLKLAVELLLLCWEQEYQALLVLVLDDKNVGHLFRQNAHAIPGMLFDDVGGRIASPMGKHQQLRLLSRNDVLQFGRPSKWCKWTLGHFALDENRPNVRKDSTFEVL
jgi:hypothetical protein